MKSKLLIALFGTLFANLTMGDSARFSNDILKDTFGFNENSKALVAYDQIHQGCRARDCIPSIENPSFTSSDKASLLDDQDIVMVVDYNGVQKAYPLKIMQGHEIVNDKFGGKPLAVTYCPLCASAVAFVPEVAGEIVEFGVSGLLYNSDLVMYDRKTYSLWSQITGKAIMGEQTGASLQSVYVAQIRWQQAKQHFDKLLVLEPPVGSRQNYRRNYYKDYFRHDKTMFPVPLKDNRLRQKAKVHGFVIDGQAVAVGHIKIRKAQSITEFINNKSVTMTLNKDGTLKVVDNTTGNALVPISTFWFAWFNFHPDTLLLK